MGSDASEHPQQILPEWWNLLSEEHQKLLDDSGIFAVNDATSPAPIVPDDPLKAMQNKVRAMQDFISVIERENQLINHLHEMAHAIYVPEDDDIGTVELNSLSSNLLAAKDQRLVVLRKMLHDSMEFHSESKLGRINLNHAGGLEVRIHFWINYDKVLYLSSADAKREEMRQWMIRNT